MSFNGVPIVASADIPPCRFVSISGDFTAAKSGANAEPLGIAQQQASRFDTPTVAFASGEPIAFYGEGMLGWLELGGTVAAGGDIISDSVGRGVARATTGTTIQYVGAKAIQGGATGNIIPVVVTLMAIRPALT